MGGSPVEIIERRSFVNGHPSLVRAINRRTVIEAFEHHGALSRAQTARIVGLSKPTVSEVFADLLESKVIHETGRTHGTQGPKAALCQVNHEIAWVVGIDVGRRWIRAALSDMSGEIATRRDERVRLRSSQTLLAQIADIARHVVSDHGLDWDRVDHVTVGSPGVMDPTRRLMMLAADLPGLDRQGFVEAVRERLETEVAFENDVNLAALGERSRGHGRNHSTFAYFWIGTGVGLGLVIDGELYRGVHGLAGEIGNLPITNESDTGPSAHRAPSEGWYRSPAVTSALNELAEGRGLDAPPALERVFAMAREGDGLARSVVDILAGLIARAVAAVDAIMDPDAVILGGGVGHNGDLLLQPIERELRTLSPLPPTVMTSALGTDAVLHGAIGTSVAATWDRLLGSVTPSVYTPS